MKMIQCGLYKLKDKYFSDFPSPNKRYMDNKAENRPYYLAIQDKSGVIWLLPLSSQVDNYKAKIAADEKIHGECIKYHIIQFMGEEKAVLIGNMIPVTPQYIKGEFTVRNQHYIVRNEASVKAIKHKTSRYLALVRAKRLKPAVDILATERVLINRMKNESYIV